MGFFAVREERFIRSGNNSELIIKETDEAGCVVLVNKPHYKKNHFSTFK